MIRFWDTSALVKVFHAGEGGHARAVGLLRVGSSRAWRQMTSLLAVVELMCVLVRETRDRRIAASALRVLSSFGQVALIPAHRDLAVRLAFTGMARGADTAIAAQAVAVAAAAQEKLEFITADVPQARLMAMEARTRRLAVRLIVLPV